MSTEDRRIQKTKKAIDDACWKLIEEKDFELITISDIANNVNINRATFYRYHADKYDWLEKKFDAFMQEISIFKHCIHPGQEPAKLMDSFFSITQHFDKNFHYYYILLQNKGTHFLQKRFHKILKEFLQPEISGSTINPVESDLLFHSIVAAVSGTMEWWIQNNRPLSAEQMAHFMFSLYLKLIRK